MQPPEEPDGLDRLGPPASTPPEVLEQGSERPPRRRRPRWLTGRVSLGLGTSLAVLLAGGWAVDARLRGPEREALADCAESAEQSSSAAQRRLAFMSDYVSPALYAVPAGPRRDGLYVLVAGAARDTRPAVQRALATCRDTDVAWFHRALRREREGYVAYLAAEADRLAGVSADGSAYYRDTPDLSALRAALFSS